MRRYLSMIVCVLMILVMTWIVAWTHNRNQQHDLEILTQSIQRAIVSEYAITGCYPDDVEAVLDKYGIQIDEKKYSLEYEVFASNQRPNVEIHRRGEVQP